MAAQDSDNTALESGLGSVGKPELEAESLVVDWDGPDDVANPINWPSHSRWAQIIMISVLGLVTYVASPLSFLDTRAHLGRLPLSGTWHLPCVLRESAVSLPT